MHSNVTIKNVSWPHFSWATLYKTYTCHSVPGDSAKVEGYYPLDEKKCCDIFEKNLRMYTPPTCSCSPKKNLACR